MITITKAAAAQIRKSAERSDSEDMYLRIAAKREEDGSIEYGMGFDDMKPQDQLYKSGGVEVVIADSCKDLLAGATIDYVEINPGQPQFIFINPNDPRHQTPQEGQPS
jgi:iron-sulfur cluster assembly protein